MLRAVSIVYLRRVPACDEQGKYNVAGSTSAVVVTLSESHEDFVHSGLFTFERVVYGDLLSWPEDTNHVGRVYRVYDGAGVATTLAFDFKGNATSEDRQLVSTKTTRPDWSALLGETTIAQMVTAAASLLDSEVFGVSTQRDALDRVIAATSPDDSEVLYSYASLLDSPDDSEVLYTYDEGGACDSNSSALTFRGNDEYQHS